jgi:hypothetical protein
MLQTGLAVLLSQVWLAVSRNRPGYVAKSAWLCCKKRLGCVPNRPSRISRVSKPFHSAFLPFAASSVVVLTCVFRCVLWYLLSTSCHQLLRVCSRWDFWGERFVRRSWDSGQSYKETVIKKKVTKKLDLALIHPLSGLTLSPSLPLCLCLLICFSENNVDKNDICISERPRW